jgi:glycosyltransferase involved in cell wall biosynthesis
MKGMKISIIIPAFNEERLIAGTLASVREGMKELSRRGVESELIVCDNNSTDRTAEIARAAGAKVVFEPINQIARARNRGAAAAAGVWLIFVDADSNPSRELFGDVADEIAAGRCLAGGVTVKLDGDHPVTGRAIFIWNWTSRACHWFAGSFIFCNAEAFRTVGGFSSELFVAEEIDLSKRFKLLARANGKKVVILHRHPLLTSARKMELYSASERLRFVARAMLRGGRISRNREDCSIWYDGRR